MIDILFFILIASLSQAMILFWIYQTNLIPEYLKVIINFIPKENVAKLRGIFLLDAWEINSNNINYLEYLSKIYHKSFLLKLLSCAVCFSFWLSTFACIICQNLFLIPSISFISLILYFEMKNLILHNN